MRTTTNAKALMRTHLLYTQHKNLTPALVCSVDTSNLDNDVKTKGYRLAYIPFFMTDVAFGYLQRSSHVYDYRHKEKQLFNRVLSYINSFDAQFFQEAKRELSGEYNLAEHQNQLEKFKKHIDDDLFRIKLRFSMKLQNHEDKEVLLELLMADLTLQIVIRFFHISGTLLDSIYKANTQLINLIADKQANDTDLNDRDNEPFFASLRNKLFSFDLSDLMSSKMWLR